mgnify:CR=1 FL=1
MASVGSHESRQLSELRAALEREQRVSRALREVGSALGEMRDLETMSMAITAAETGHLVLSSIHTTSASRTISTLIDAFPPGQQEQITLDIRFQFGFHLICPWCANRPVLWIQKPKILHKKAIFC